MTKEEFESNVPLIQPLDFIFVSVDPNKADKSELASLITQWGTGQFCHVEVKAPDCGEEQNIVITANGKKVCYEKLKKYLVNPKAYKLTIKRLRNISNEGQVKMIAEIDRQIKANINYDWQGIRGMAYKSLLTKIPVLGFFINKFIWKVPNIHNSKDMFCVESAGRIANSSGQVKVIETCPPQQLADNDCFETILVIG